ncbi:MAG: DUF4832 domain-containing protein [Treponema sp.]|nr:DUF4832 domain-containing protein [Treponema sp.]
MNTIARIFALTAIAAGTLFFPYCASAGGSHEQDVLNPERGWYIARETDDLDELNEFRTKRNVTVFLMEANLTGFLTGPLSTAKLNEIDRAFDRARAAGLSVIFRAAYTYGDEADDAYENYNKNKNNNKFFEPTDINIILGHVEQLGNIFHKHEDILFNVQAGFFGPWGEWHSSYYSPGQNEPIRTQYQRQLINKLLEAVPQSVTIAVRRPEYIRTVAVAGSSSDPVSAEEAFGPSAIARLAFHNDALMSDDTDMDTYPYGKSQREAELRWVHGQTRFTPMVAETNLPSNYNNTKNAVETLDTINIQLLNCEYHPRVLGKWQHSNYKGVNGYDYIGLRLGYRFVLNRAELSQQGDILNLDLQITNEGFGHLLKKKKFELVLKNGSQTYRAAINEDARFWDKDVPVIRNYRFRLPAEIRAGNWDAYLGLSSESLPTRPEYSVQFIFANNGSWEPVLGLNRIGSAALSALTGGGGAVFEQIAE